MTEFMIDLGAKGQHKLRFMKKELTERKIDFGFVGLVGDKAIRIFSNNLVEIADLEFIRAEDIDEAEDGLLAVAYMERLNQQYTNSCLFKSIPGKFSAWKALCIDSRDEFDFHGTVSFCQKLSSSPWN
ncbi:MAG: hypothetical protein H7318_00670 [Oligoflexus sp.]|nr:hypothetical protein [Oligoflexus sp.]